MLLLVAAAATAPSERASDLPVIQRGGRRVQRTGGKIDLVPRLSRRVIGRGRSRGVCSLTDHGRAGARAHAPQSHTVALAPKTTAVFACIAIYYKIYNIMSLFARRSGARVNNNIIRVSR